MLNCCGLLICCRQFMRYGRFEGHMCERHADYLAWLWSSSDVSCLSSIGLPLRPTRNDPPSDQVCLGPMQLQNQRRGPQQQRQSARSPRWQLL